MANAVEISANGNTVRDAFPFPTKDARLDGCLTGFNELSTAEISPIIELKSNYGNTVLRDETTVTGAGAVNNAVGDGRYEVTSGATANSTARLRTVEYGRYVAGSESVAGVGLRIPTAPTGNQEIRWGYYTSVSGFGLGYDADGLFVFIRRNSSDTTIRRADWDDPLDGTGTSGVTLDLADVNIFQIRFRWYGSGPAVFYVSAIIDNEPRMVPFVIEEAPNGQPIVSDPNLPLTIDVLNGASGGTIAAYVYGRQFGIRGRYDPNRRLTSDYRLALGSIGDTFLPLIACRQKTPYRSVSAKISGVQIVTDQNILWEMRVFPDSLTGGAYAAPTQIPSTETSMEFNLGATAISGGQVISRGFSVGGQGATTGLSDADVPMLDLPINVDVVLCARRIGAQNATVSSKLTIREEW